MNDFPSVQKWTDEKGNLTLAAREWLAALVRELRDLDARVALLES